MEAKELRIGNYVYYNGTNGPTKNVNKIDGEDIKLMSEKSDYLKLHSPIPLAEIWLKGLKQTGILFEKDKFAIKKWEVILNGCHFGKTQGFLR